MKTKEEILGLSDENIIPIEIPEWDTSMFIRRLTGAEVSRLRGLGVSKKEATYIMAATCCAGLCNEDGSPVFTFADAAALEKKSYAVIDFISTEILIHSKCMERPTQGEGEEKN